MKELILRMAEAMKKMDEAKKLDPVNKKALSKDFDDRADKDIDNDGDTDSSDEYLHNRRATIKKTMKHSKSGKLGHKDIDESSDEMDECPECGGSTENHDPDCSRAESSKKKKLDDDLDAKSAGKAMKHDCATHVASESWGYGECIPGQHTLVEQDDGTAIVTHYDVMFEHGIEENVAVEDLTILREKSHMHASKQYMDRGKGKMANDGANKAATDAKARIKARAAKRAGMKEAKQPDHAEKGKGEKILDKYKGKGAKDMASDNSVGNPKVELDGVEIEKEKMADMKQSPARGAADKLNVGDKKPVKQGAK